MTSKGVWHWTFPEIEDPDSIEQEYIVRIIA